jgi:hypothetical protein
VWTVEEESQESEVPDSTGIRRQARNQERVAKEGNSTLGLTEWLVRTILLVGCAIWNPDGGGDRKSIFTDADRGHSFVRYWVIEPN